MTSLGTLRGIGWYPLLDTTNTSTRPAWEAWAKKNIITQTVNLPFPDSRTAFNTINNTAYKYGIYNKTSATSRARDGNVIGGDPRFAHWIFPAWQVAPLGTSSSAIFLDAHAFLGTRHDTIEKILAGIVGVSSCLTSQCIRRSLVCLFLPFSATLYPTSYPFFYPPFTLSFPCTPPCYPCFATAGSAGIGGAFTNIVQLSTDSTYRPSTNLYLPVYSTSVSATPPILYGLVDIILSWDLLMSNVLPNNLPRLDCVVTTKSSTFTLSIDHGTVNVVGPTDLHDSTMTTYGQNIVIDLINQSPLSASDFTITVYPSTAFYNQYITQGPIQISISLAVAVFVFFCVINISVTYYTQQREKIRQENERLEKSQEEAQRAHEDAKKAELDR